MHHITLFNNIVVYTIMQLFSKDSYRILNIFITIIISFVDDIIKQIEDSINSKF